jgi:hypothetical protein
LVISRRGDFQGWFQDNGVVPHRTVARGSIRASGLGVRRHRAGRSETGRRECSAPARGRGGGADCRAPAWFRRAREHVRCQSRPPVAFGRAWRAGSSAKAHPASARREGAVVAAAAAEADQYTAAAGEFIDSFERSDCIRPEWGAAAAAIGTGRPRPVPALGSSCLKASFRLPGYRLKACRPRAEDRAGFIATGSDGRPSTRVVTRLCAARLLARERRRRVVVTVGRVAGQRRRSVARSVSLGAECVPCVIARGHVASRRRSCC